jgi:hypothetical protein
MNTTTDPSRQPANPRMSRLPLPFLAPAATCLVAGVALGMGHNFQLAPVHGHTTLVGWTSLVLMGSDISGLAQVAAGPLAYP